MSGRLPRPNAEAPSGARKPPGRAQLPLLDRLIDEAPDESVDPPISAAAAMEALRRSIRADLEALLNSRRRWQSWDPSLRELDRSLVGYGLPDFASGAFNDRRRREDLRALIEASIRRFEPRITSLTVTLVNPDDTLTQSFKIRIDALLEAEPAPEPIAFDTVIDPVSTTLTVLANEG